MRTEAEVIRTNGNVATVRVKRSSMCDGCSKNGCDGACSAASLFGGNKAVESDAVNEIGAMPGDSVIVESSDKRILSFAALVFILPIIICALAYAAAFALLESEKLSILVGFAAFALTFVAIGFFERLIRNRRPDVVICEIIGQK